MDMRYYRYIDIYISKTNACKLFTKCHCTNFTTRTSLWVICQNGYVALPLLWFLCDSTTAEIRLVDNIQHVQELEHVSFLKIKPCLYNSPLSKSWSTSGSELDDGKRTSPPANTFRWLRRISRWPLWKPNDSLKFRPSPPSTFSSTHWPIRLT